MNGDEMLNRELPDFEAMWQRTADIALEVIPQLAGVKMRDDLDIDIQHDVDIRTEHVQPLLDSRLWKKRRHEMPGEWVRKARSLKPSKEVRPISTDILGEYLPDKRKIVVHDETCLLVVYGLAVKGGSACVPVRSGPSLALTHLISHAVSRLGEDDEGRTWEGYEDASLERKDLFAQGYSCQFFRTHGGWLNSMLFASLSEHQSADYSLWREYVNDLDELNRRLVEARMSGRPRR